MILASIDLHMKFQISSKSVKIIIFWLIFNKIWQNHIADMHNTLETKIIVLDTSATYM